MCFAFFSTFVKFAVNKIRFAAITCVAIENKCDII